MESEKVGIREFRENLAAYLEGGRPLAITKHGETLGFFVPAKKRNLQADLEAMRAAAKDMDEIIQGWGATEEELMAEIEEIRQAERQKNRRDG
jgi:antitoxin (DNA-binding transcriptional repressor) of toxin-antitoxin stability system